MVTNSDTSGVIWRGSEASFSSRRTIQGVKVTYSKSIDLSKYSIPKASLLGEAISNFITPIDFTEANQLFAMLNSIKEDREAMRILATPVENLNKQELKDLFRRMETFIADNPSISAESRNSISSFWRRPFVRPSFVLGDGTLSDATGFTSCFPSHNSAEGKIRAGQKKASAIYSNEFFSGIDPKEPEASWKASISASIENIESACWQVIDEYLSVRGKHVQLLQSIANQQPVPKAESYLASALHRIQKDKLYLIQNWLPQVAINFENITGLTYHYSRYIEIEPKRLFSFQHKWPEYFFSEYYLPRLPIQAAQLLILIRTGWNVSTVAALEREQISINIRYCDIFATKSKTSDSVHTRIYQSKEPRLFNLISLIVQNDEAVSRNWIRANKTLWVSWSNRTREFIADKYTKSLTTLAKNYGIKRLTKKAIRDYKHVNDWLDHGDVFQTKEEMGHDSIDTTVAYLNLNIFSALNEANIANFMTQLSQTIIWIGQEGIPEEVRSDLLNGYSGSHLLFPMPTTDTSTDEAVCDRWINGIGEVFFRIGSAEIRHLRWQMQYYAKYALDLSRDNPQYFQAVHLPRMIFAAALSRIVAESPYERFLHD